MKQRVETEISAALAALAVAVKQVEAAEALAREAERDLKSDRVQQRTSEARAGRSAAHRRSAVEHRARVGVGLLQPDARREVGRGSDGQHFTVDTHSIAGLSGSTLDLLGLSIRLALTRTFLPMAPFLILDEPFAAMDEERTAASLAFIASAGFKQTLLVTHEEMSESVAAGLITLEVEMSTEPTHAGKRLIESWKRP